MDKLPQRATVADIAVIIERSESRVRECIHARGLKRGKDGKYEVAPICAEHIQRQKRNTHAKKGKTSNNATLNDPTTWADKLKAKQVEKLDVQIQELRGNLISKDEMRTILSEHAAAVRGALENWVQLIAANKRDPSIMKWAEDMQDRATAMISERINDY